MFPVPTTRDLMTHWVRRAAGAAVLGLSVLPLYQLLPRRDTGLAGRSTSETVALQAELLWSGFLILAGLAVTAGMLLPPDAARRALSALARPLLRLSHTAYAAAVGVVAMAVTAMVTHAVFERRPNLVDALLQLTHARYFAAGELGGPALFADGFWHMQNGLVTASGWYSQYPPGHIALLAGGIAVGAAWLVGPVVHGATAALTYLTLARLLPDRPGVARAAALAAALSPFLMAQAATYMNHASAALLAVTSVYCAVRALPRSLPWGAASGAAVAALAAVRPLTAVVMMLVVIAVWVMHDSARLPRLARLGLAAVAGGLPLVAAQLWYNHAAFGGFAVFGYDATWGPAHGLGFHRDPWGNQYGGIEALLYTSADLSALNLSLLETLLPHVSIVGLYLALAPSLSRGERVLAVWALLPLVANALYWHHGQFMGPRMLAEYAPAWIALAMVSMAGLLRAAPAAVGGGSRFSPRTAMSVLVLGGTAAFALMAPQRLWSYGGDWLPGFRTDLPPAPRNSIVFVHGAWETRIMSRLAARGVRLDRVETAMRQNPTCLVHRHLVASGAGVESFGAMRGGLPPLDLDARTREYLPRLLVARDSRVRVDTTTPLHPSCIAEVRSDRYGAADASFILWLGDLPGIETGRPLFARDLGPEANRRLLARYPERSAWVYGYFDESDSLRLLPYEEGIARLWNAP